jgi:hypothetical protein
MNSSLLNMKFCIVVTLQIFDKDVSLKISGPKRDEWRKLYHKF